MLGIVIANWNGAKLLQQCLESLIIQEFADFIVYIIDNGSIDNSVEVIDKYKKKLNIQLTTLSSNEGFAKANNIGIKQAIEAECNYILTLNNDTKLKKDTLSNAMKSVRINKNYDIYQLLMLNFFDQDICDVAGITWGENLLPIQIGEKSKLEKILSEDIKPKGACAGAAIYSRESLEKVKLKNGDYFDSKFFAYYEDVDLALRLYNNKFKTMLIKDAIVYHVHSATSSKSNGLKEYYVIRNLFLYTTRNQSKVNFNKNKWTYYEFFLKALIKNMFNNSIRKSLIKGFGVGIKEARDIENINIII